MTDRFALWRAKQTTHQALHKLSQHALLKIAMPSATRLCHVIGQKLGDVTNMSQWRHHGLQLAAGVRLESHSKTANMFDNAKKSIYRKERGEDGGALVVGEEGGYQSEEVRLVSRVLEEKESFLFSAQSLTFTAGFPKEVKTRNSFMGSGKWL